MTSPSFSLPSFAKINWSLRILGKRPDGYHEINTVLQTISLHDDLHFLSDESEEIVLTCDDPLIPTNTSNLIVRAAEQLREHSGITKGAAISLKKRIPAKGGLGGGSSNAAVALLGLSKLWELDVGYSELAEIGSSLGADVPFFLAGGRALGKGIGTRLTLAPDNVIRHLIIISPNATVSTVEAYGALDAPALTTMVSDPILAISRTKADFADSDQWVPSDQLANDFEQVIFDIEPEIWRAKNALLQAGARSALLAGSGSSVFGIFDDSEAQRRASSNLRVEDGWRVFSCVTLSRDEYQRALGMPLLGALPKDPNTGA
ncbi:MAG: 4-(cytidine 5'-diphospho)-2-C-methyl-D-erythritol kinase [bacterium]